MRPSGTEATRRSISAAHQLRKAAEDTALRYRKVAKSELPPTGEFHSLADNLRAAKNHLVSELPMALFDRLLKGVPELHREKLVCLSDEDLDNDDTLDAETRGRLKTQRKRLKSFLSDEAWKHLETIRIIDAVSRMKDRVLNPAAHWNETPLYDREVSKALTLIERLRKCLADGEN